MIDQTTFTFNNNVLLRQTDILFFVINSLVWIAKHQFQIFCLFNLWTFTIVYKHILYVTLSYTYFCIFLCLWLVKKLYVKSCLSRPHRWDLLSLTWPGTFPRFKPQLKYFEKRPWIFFDSNVIFLKLFSKNFSPQVYLYMYSYIYFT